MKDLMEIRRQIDEIDRQVVDLYEQRLRLAEEVAEYKIANGKKVFDKEREEEKLRTLSALAKSDFSRQGISELFEQIMSTSRKRQYRMLAEHGLLTEPEFSCVPAFDFTGKNVVYQGVEGAYSQMAMRAFFGEREHAYHVATWREAMEAITAGDADYAVLPIENSSAGAVTQNYDLLMEYDVAIIGEQILKIDHALLGIKGARISDITCVYSHPQAFMQCASYLEKEHPQFEKKTMKNTAVSARKIREDGDVSQAAIAGKINASLYGLDILEESIQDNRENKTRFIIVAGEKTYLESADTVSLCLELPNDKGSLYHILSHFIFNGLNMSRIESRPIPGKNWEYRFFIDFQGNLREEAVKNALGGLREETDYLKILGNY